MASKKPHKTRAAAKKPKTAGEIHNFQVTETSHGGFGISIDGRELSVPFGKPFWTPSRSYAQWVIDRLSEGGDEHFAENKALLCHECTFFIGYSNGISDPENEHLEKFRKTLAYSATWDPIHSLCAGPEVVDQRARLQPFFEYCGDRGIQSPSWSQGAMGVFEGTDIREVVNAKSYGEANLSDLRYFEILERDLKRLSPAQLSVVHTYFYFADSYMGRPTVLPMLLVKGLCSPKEFAEGFLATLCVIPEVFGDVSKAQYRRELKKLERDAERALLFLKHH